jgi:hypothetical protein
MFRGLSTVLLLLLLPALPTQAGEAVPAFVDRIVEAYGGAAALSDPSAVRQRGHTVSNMRGGETGALMRVFQGSDKLRVEIGYPGEAPEVRVLDGRQGWTKGAEATGPMTGAMQLQAARMALPQILLEHKARVMDQGMTKGPDGTDVRVLELPLGPHRVLFVGADEATGLIHFSSGLMKFGGGQSMEFATVYSDFKDWNGRLFAGREEQYAMGRHTGYNVIEAVELLESVGAETFRP